MEESASVYWAGLCVLSALLSAFAFAINWGFLMDTITCVLAWVEAHSALTQFLGFIIAAIIALLAARTAYQGVMKQIGAELILEKLSKNHEKETIYCAFAADLDALRKSLDGFHEALKDDAAIEGRGICKSVIFASRNVVWESCAPKIGVIDANNAANIIETYRFIDGVKGRVRELNLENIDHRNDLASLIKDAIEQIDNVLTGLPIRPDEEITDPK